MEKDQAYETFLKRRAVRKYTEKRVPKEILEKIAKAGSYAPSGMGRQPARIVVITNQRTRSLLSRLNGEVMGAKDDPFYGAKDVMAVFSDSRVPTYLQDGSLVMGNLLNAACSLGVDSCWIHRAKEVFQSEEGRKLKREWGLEDAYEGIGFCILGYHDGDYPEAKPRADGFIRFVE